MKTKEEIYREILIFNGILNIDSDDSWMLNDETDAVFQSMECYASQFKNEKLMKEIQDETIIDSYFDEKQKERFLGILPIGKSVK